MLQTTTEPILIRNNHCSKLDKIMLVGFHNGDDDVLSIILDTSIDLNY